MKGLKLLQLFSAMTCCLAPLFVVAHTPLSSTAVSIERKDSPPLNHQSPTEWFFSGIVTNENNEAYSYYFQLQQQNNNEFYAVAALFNLQTQKNLLFESQHAHLDNPSQGNWKVGKLFLQFNPITNNWIFGLKSKDKIGFNFKVDMLKKEDSVPLLQNLHPGLAFSIKQAGRLNGHFRIADDPKEQFITAQRTWFRQIYTNKLQSFKQPLEGVLCQFHDGSGFYAANLKEKDAIRGSLAGWRNEEGNAVMMSQFVNLKKEHDHWHIRVPVPSLHLVLQDFLGKNYKDQLTAGTVKGSKSGFCIINKNEPATTG